MNEHHKLAEGALGTPESIVMGVAGAGKTTVGSQLARELGWNFLDADSLHSPENVAKMRSGEPLEDADRAPWLAALRGEMQRAATDGFSLVLACSALKERYRRELRVSLASKSPGSNSPESNSEVRFVYLRTSFEELRKRLKERTGHFVTESLLESQIQTLEEPGDAIAVDAARPVSEIVAEIRLRIHG